MINDERDGRQAVRFSGGQRLSVDADSDTVWELLADIESWSGLMPHIMQAHLCDERGERRLLRLQMRPVWWCRFWLWLGADLDAGRRCLTLWYPAGLARGIVERWYVAGLEDDRCELHWSIHAASPRQRLLARLLIEPLATRTAEMIELLAEADFQARRRYT